MALITSDCINGPDHLDSRFQLVAATFFGNVGGSTYIPFQVEGFYYYKHPADVCKSQKLWAHAKERSRSPDGQVLHSDVMLFGEDGTLIMAVVDLHLKKAGGGALIKRCVLHSPCSKCGLPSKMMALITSGCG